ncbi:Histone-Lysine N-Methyltransferase Ehmt1 [Manis pentadactyla]|nr:Histone-Lysine N-Methyltransferase Ehmt1 [Manis pentadactyla]
MGEGRAGGPSFPSTRSAPPGLCGPGSHFGKRALLWLRALRFCWIGSLGRALRRRVWSLAVAPPLPVIASSGLLND